MVTHWWETTAQRLLCRLENLLGPFFVGKVARESTPAWFFKQLPFNFEYWFVQVMHLGMDAWGNCFYSLDIALLKSAPSSMPFRFFPLCLLAPLALHCVLIKSKSVFYGELSVKELWRKWGLRGNKFWY